MSVPTPSWHQRTAAFEASQRRHQAWHSTQSHYAGTRLTSPVFGPRCGPKDTVPLFQVFSITKCGFDLLTSHGGVVRLNLDQSCILYVFLICLCYDVLWQNSQLRMLYMRTITETFPDNQSRTRSWAFKSYCWIEQNCYRYKCLLKFTMHNIWQSHIKLWQKVMTIRLSVLSYKTRCPKLCSSVPPSCEAPGLKLRDTVPQVVRQWIKLRDQVSEALRPGAPNCETVPKGVRLSASSCESQCS